MRISIAIFIILCAQIVWANDAKFIEAKKKHLEGNIFKAYELLKETDDSKFSPEKLSLKYFSLGIWASELGKNVEAKGYLLHAIDLGSLQSTYAYFLLGKLSKNSRNYSDAKANFKKLLELNPPRNIVYDTRFLLSEIAIHEKKWNEAYNELKYLERRWRSHKSYPEVLWRLIKVEKKRKRDWKACRWARKIYADHPVHALVYDWGIDLPKNKYDGKRIDCVASVKDQKRRIRRLHFSGEGQRARREIDLLRKRAEGAAKYEVDIMYSDFMIKEGYVDEALNVLLKYASLKKKDLSFLRKLARAAAKAGKNDVAIGSYYKIFQLKPKSRKGRNALFSAAFLSYQVQDYDGATRKFSDYVKRFKRGKSLRDAQWYLAWIRYLKADYSGAVYSFAHILQKKERHRRRWRHYSEERIKYWLGMSYLKLGRNAKAREYFEELVQDKLVGYYTVASYYRLKQLPQEKPLNDIASIQQGEFFNREKVDPIARGPLLPNPDLMEENVTPLGDRQIASQEENDEDGDEEGEGVAEREEGFEESIFKDPELAKRYERATQLIQTGFYFWAKWELYEIERRTRNKVYLKKIMQSYEDIGSYNRSTFVGYTYFQKERNLYGIPGSKELWQFAYPKAFQKPVIDYSTRFNVPMPFTWGIMRAESHFKHDVVSPVGAKGLMQIMPYTGVKVSKLLGESGFHHRQLMVPDINIRLGTRYLSRLLKKFNSSVPLAAASYNAGPHRVEKWLYEFGDLEMDEFIEHIPFRETRNYVKKVVRNYSIYNELYENKKDPLAILVKPLGIEVENPSTRENWSDL